MKSLKIGKYSFSEYTVIEIENVDALEVIEMGDCSFLYASTLELKSIRIHSEWWLDMPSLKSLLFDDGAFYDCTRAVFESDWLWCEWLTRLVSIDFHSIGLECIPFQLQG